MDDIFKNIPMSVSVIDYLGKIEDGVGLLLSLVIQENVYEITLWYNMNGQFRIVPDEKLLNKLKVTNIYEYVYIKELMYFIQDSLGDMEKIINEFVK